MCIPKLPLPGSPPSAASSALWILLARQFALSPCHKRYRDRELCGNMKTRVGLFFFFCHSGLVVDQDALVEALQNKVIKAAALDVTYPEPLPRLDIFFKLNRSECVCCKIRKSLWACKKLCNFVACPTEMMSPIPLQQQSKIHADSFGEFVA